MDDEQRRERNKVIGGLILGLWAFGLFLYYLLSHLPSR